MSDTIFPYDAWVYVAGDRGGEGKVARESREILVSLDEAGADYVVIPLSRKDISNQLTQIPCVISGGACYGLRETKSLIEHAGKRSS